MTIDSSAPPRIPFAQALAGAQQAVRPTIGLILAAALPLGVFGLANLAAEMAGIVPLFFAPFGLTGPMGAILHLATLPLIGAAGWLATRDSDSHLHLWLGALIAAVIALPFVAMPLDSLQMSLATTGLFLLALATAQRVAAASPLAGWLLVPALGWMGISAALGLVFAAAWSPPFALTQSGETPVVSLHG